MLFGKVAQQVALAFFQVFKGPDSELPQDIFSHLPFDAPDIRFLSPQQIEPYLVALLANLGHLVIDPQNDVPTAKCKRLDLPVFPMLAVLVASADETVLVKIDYRKVVIEGEVDPRKTFRPVCPESNRSRPSHKLFMTEKSRFPPESLALEGNEKLTI